MPSDIQPHVEWTGEHGQLRDQRAGQTRAGPNAASNTDGCQFDDRGFSTKVVYLPGLASWQPEV